MIEHKGYYVKPHKEFPTHYVVVTAGKGGKIPDILSSLFTRKDYAIAAIDSYLDSKEKKGVGNGEAIGKG